MYFFMINLLLLTSRYIFMEITDTRIFTWRPKSVTVFSTITTTTVAFHNTTSPLDPFKHSKESPTSPQTHPFHSFPTTTLPKNKTVAIPNGSSNPYPRNQIPNISRIHHTIHLNHTPIIANQRTCSFSHLTHPWLRTPQRRQFRISR